MTDITEKKNLLTKDTDFSGWFRYMLIELEDKGMVGIDGQPITVVNQTGEAISQERAIYRQMMKRIHTDVIATIPTRIQNGTDLIKYLTETKLGGNRYELETKYSEFRMFAHQRDAQRYIDHLEMLEQKIIYAGGTVTAREKYAKLTSHLNVQAYAQFITLIRTEYDSGKKAIDDDAVNSIRERLLVWSRCMPLEHDKKEKAFKTEIRDGGDRPPFQERECTICKEKFPNRVVRNGKILVYRTHNTADHNEGNKAEVKAYSEPLLLDTCSSTHIVKDIPVHLNTKDQGTVKGSIVDADPARIIGSGNFKIDNLSFKASVAPRLDANLLSAGKLVKEGYAAVLKRNISPGTDVKIFKDNKTVATGHITANNMIKLDGQMHEVKKTTIEEHKEFGHLGKCECRTCLEAKRRKMNIVKGKGREYKPLENISVDMQGPISIKAVDGSKYNMKMVDSKSKYVTVVPTSNKKSITTANIYDYFLKRNERATGNRVKFTATDGGTEFYGSFLDLLEREGIQKVRGVDYEHSFPIDAENANGILNGMTRANLTYSKLPATYWTYALKHAAYSYNRKGDPSPYEKLYGIAPRLDHLRTFGDICYAYKP